MGTNVTSIGLKHKLHTNKPKLLVKEISETFNQPVIVEYSHFHHNNELEIVRLYTYPENVQIDARENAICIELPSCDYIKQNYRQVPFDINSPDLEKSIAEVFQTRDSNYYDVCVFPNEYTFYVGKENVWFEDLGYRWFFISEWFKDGCKHEFFKSYIEDINKSVIDIRANAKQQAELFGCSIVSYLPDQGFGEFILENLNMSADDFIEYLINKKSFKDYWRLYERNNKTWKNRNEYLDSMLVIETKGEPQYANSTEMNDKVVMAVIDYFEG